MVHSMVWHRRCRPHWRMLDTYYSKEKYADPLIYATCGLRLLVLCPSSPSTNPSYGHNATAAFGYTDPTYIARLSTALSNSVT
jgi:hypothetical protein